MIGWLKGEVLAIEKDEVLVNVAGVGYWVALGQATRQRLGLEIGKKAELYIYTSVREDEIRLFGFKDLEGRKLFLSLLSVNGVGPKAGGALLDQLSPGEMVQAIQKGDYKVFTQVSGIGAKTARRIVFDLTGKIEPLQLEKESSPSAQATLFAGGQVAADARSALANLGIPDKEADKVIQSHLKPDITINELLRLCLSDLQRNGSGR